METTGGPEQAFRIRLFGIKGLEGFWFKRSFEVSVTQLLGETDLQHLNILYFGDKPKPESIFLDFPTDVSSADLPGLPPLPSS